VATVHTGKSTESFHIFGCCLLGLSETDYYIRYFQTANVNFRNNKMRLHLINISFGSVVGCGTMLQAGRSRVWFPVRSLDFSIYLILPAALWPWGSTPPLTEMSTRNLPRGKGRSAHKAENLTAICEPAVYKMWQLRHLTTVWAFTACYRDSFTFFSFFSNYF
jgi:hypothetical protein